MGQPAGEPDPRGLGIGLDYPHSQKPLLYSLLDRLRLALTSSFNAQTVWQLRRRIEHQSSLVRQAGDTFTSYELFEKASAAARMGLWQCELPSQRLAWSNGTYDLFGMERHRALARSEILKSYSEESLFCLERIRGGAIASGSGFSLDAEIRNPEGGTRWIRISATIDRRNGEPIRLFGIKQDISEEKLRLDRMSYLAEHDVMTGLANRAQFQSRFDEICKPGEPGGALMLVDLDGFKEVNDTFGHAVGDECLVEIAHRLSARCGAAEMIARIGGDEFALLFGPSVRPEKIENIAQLIIRTAEAPVKCSGCLVRVGASIGYAFTEGETPAAVFTRADQALYAAKAAGCHTFRGSSRAA